MINNTKNTTHREIAEIEADLKVASRARQNWINIQNEGAGGYVDDTRIEALSQELIAAQKARSPLASNLSAEIAWFNAQGYTGLDLQKANKACLARGYALYELQAACKAAKEGK